MSTSSALRVPARRAWAPPVREVGSSGLDRRPAPWPAPDPLARVASAWPPPAGLPVSMRVLAPWPAPRPTDRAADTGAADGTAADRTTAVGGAPLPPPLGRPSPLFERLRPVALPDLASMAMPSPAPPSPDDVAATSPIALPPPSPADLLLADDARADVGDAVATGSPARAIGAAVAGIGLVVAVAALLLALR